ncbi:MAG: hypothetical protein ACQKBU_08885 [Verrucomicrobiales bacterium]
MLTLLAETVPLEKGLRFFESACSGTCAGVLVGASIAIPLAMIGSIVGSRARMSAPRWYDSLFESIGRFPTMLTTALLGLLAMSWGVESSGLLWGTSAALAGTPVMWRIVARTLSELPQSLMESALGLGFSRFQALRAAGFPLVGPALGGAAAIGCGRALSTGWLIYVASRSVASDWPLPIEWLWVVSIVFTTTLIGTWLLGLSRSISKNLERSAGL